MWFSRDLLTIVARFTYTWTWQGYATYQPAGPATPEFSRNQGRDSGYKECCCSIQSACDWKRAKCGRWSPHTHWFQGGSWGQMSTIFPRHLVSSDRNTGGRTVLSCDIAGFARPKPPFVRVSSALSSPASKNRSPLQKQTDCYLHESFMRATMQGSYSARSFPWQMLCFEWNHKVRRDSAGPLILACIR
jgi:hypothetical protein